VSNAGRWTDPALTREATSQGWRLAWHGFFYLLLAVATAASLAGDPATDAAHTMRLLPAAGLGAWHWVWQIGPRRTSGQAVRVYLLGATVLWAVLTVVDPEFLILGLAVFAPFCLQHVGVAAVLTLVVVGGVVWQWQTDPAGFAWPAVAVPLLLAAAGLLSAGTVQAIVRRSRQRQRLVEQLRATRADLAAAERQAGVLAERQRLARELHDTLAQGFASVVLLLEAAEESLATGHPAGPHVHRALRSARDNLADSRRVVWALRPQALTDRALPDALERLARQLTEQAAITAEVVVAGTVRPLDDKVEDTLLRITQEALANTRRHAAASRVTITLSYLDDVVMVDVADDGVGFDPDDGAATFPRAGPARHTRARRRRRRHPDRRERRR
jgi:signal transduction histidine kinase